MLKELPPKVLSDVYCELTVEQVRGRDRDFAKPCQGQGLHCCPSACLASTVPIVQAAMPHNRGAKPSDSLGGQRPQLHCSIAACVGAAAVPHSPVRPSKHCTAMAAAAAGKGKGKGSKAKAAEAEPQ